MHTRRWLAGQHEYLLASWQGEHHSEKTSRCFSWSDQPLGLCVLVLFPLVVLIRYSLRQRRHAKSKCCPTPWAQPAIWDEGCIPIHSFNSLVLVFTTSRGSGRQDLIISCVKKCFLLLVIKFVPFFMQFFPQTSVTFFLSYFYLSLKFNSLTWESFGISNCPSRFSLSEKHFEFQPETGGQSRWQCS